MTSHRLIRYPFARVVYSLLLALPWLLANPTSAGETANRAESTEPLRLLTEELPPLSFQVNGELTGLSVALVREIQRRLDDDRPIQLMPWARAYHSLMERPDVALFSTARSAEREDLFQWVGPLANLSFVFYKRADSPLTLDSLEDARKLATIATYRNDVREEFLLNRGFTNLDSATKLVSGARKLLEGRVDAWLDSNLSAPSVIESLGYPADSIERLLVAHSEPLYIAFSAETPPETVARWQRTLDDMARDGSFARLHRRWLPNEPMPARMAALSPDPALTDYPLTLKTENLPPYNFLQGGEAAGVSVDIVDEIQRRLGRRTPIEFVPWTRGYLTVRKTAGSVLFTTVRNAAEEITAQSDSPRDDFRAFLTLYEARFYIAFSTSTPPAVVDLWQQTLDAMRVDGSLARIYRRWDFTPSGEDP